MNIVQNASLANYSTMRLGGTAAFLVDITTPAELTEALAWAEARKLPAIMIGGGSNIIWKDEGFDGLVMINKLRGFRTEHRDDHTLVHIAAGENWDDVVARTVDEGLSGIEALSLIPGTAGATPVQNVGAYGQEIAQTLVHVEAYDRKAGAFIIIPHTDCQFAYRTSRFKHGEDRGRFYITSITLRLTKTEPVPPFYAALEKYFAEHHITHYTPHAIREAVIAIRQSKLPDPAEVANNGSFFANPVISKELFWDILAEYPEAPHWPTTEGGIKIPAAWLLQQTGFKDFHDSTTGMGTWPTQPLVLVNEHAARTADLIVFRDKIIAAVQDTFSITLEQEPEILP